MYSCHFIKMHKIKGLFRKTEGTMRAERAAASGGSELRGHASKMCMKLCVNQHNKIYKTENENHRHRKRLPIN